jgi:hypothetical protein
MSQIDLYINNTLVPIDGTSGVRLNKLITDIREPDKKGTTWSKTIKIPGTKEVNALFGNIFSIHHRIQGPATATTNFQPDFNPNLKATALLLCDGVEQLNGYARLLDIPIYNQDQIVYEIGLAGEAGDLFTQLGTKRLRDLDLTHLNHTLTRTNVQNSWATSYKRNGVDTPFVFGEGYVYPLIDKGGQAAKRKFILADLYPTVAAREIMLAIFEDAGYSWTTGSWFDSDLFKHTYIPYPGDSMALTESQMLAREWKAKRITTDQSMTYGDTLIMNDDSSSGFYDSATAYDTGTGIWTVPNTGNYSMQLELSLTIRHTAGSFGAAMPLFGLYVNGKFERDIVSGTYNRTATDQTVSFTGGSMDILLHTGDQVAVKFYGLFDRDFKPISVSTLANFKVKTGSFAQVEAEPTTHSVGELVDFAGFFDQDKTQREFVLDFCKAANLYITPDQDQDKRLIIVPRDEFYTNDILDWSKKIDLQEYQKIPLGELQDRRYLFRFADSTDISNQGYKDRYGEQFGQYTYTVNNDFVKSDREIRIGFSPTIMINYGNAWDAILPHIEYTDSKKSAGMRVLYYGGTKPCTAFTILDTQASGSSSSTYTAYPFLGHVDDPITPTVDLNWGMPREVSLHLSVGSTYTNNNFFNRFWRKQIEEITDPNSTILRGKFRLTPADWQKTTMREQVYVLGEYWRINKLEDYDPENDGLTTVELIRTKTAPSFTPTNKRKRGIDTTDTYQDKYPTVRKGVVISGGTTKPTNKGPNIGVIMGGESQYTGRQDVAFLGGGRNIVLASEVQIMNSYGCTVYPEAYGSVLLNCNNLEVFTPGYYFENRLLSSGYLQGGKTLTITGTTDIPDDTDMILANVLGGPAETVLPPAAEHEGRYITIVKSGNGNTATITAQSGEFIETSPSVELNDRTTLRSDGTGWTVINRDGSGTDSDWIKKTKRSNETRNNDSAIAVDSELAIDFIGTGVYTVRGKIWYDTQAAADFKYYLKTDTYDKYRLDVKHTAPGSITEHRRILTSPDTSPVDVLASGTDGGLIEFEAVVKISADSGMQFWWSQHTSNPGDTAVLAGSFIEYCKTTIIQVLTTAMDTGYITLTGYSAEFTRTATISLDHGTITMTGQDMTPGTTRTITLDQGAITMTGQDMTPGLSRTVALDQGSITFTGQDMTATQVDADAEALITAGPITDSTEQSAWRTLVAGLKADGLWSKTLAIYPFLGSSAGTTKYNGKNPLDTNAAFRLTMYGGLTHDSQGVTGNGSNGYMDPHFKHSNFPGQNDAGVIAVCGNNMSAGSKALYGAIDSGFSGTRHLPNLGGTSYRSIFSGTGGGLSNSDTTGRWIHTRTGATADKTYKNGASWHVSNYSSSSNSSTSSILILAANYNNGTIYQHANAELNFFAFVTGLNDADKVAYDARIATFLTTLGR